MHIIIGYRDAQCGWILVHEVEPLKLQLPKVAQCLCIYAARRGILEVHTYLDHKTGPLNHLRIQLALIRMYVRTPSASVVMMNCYGGFY